MIEPTHNNVKTITKYKKFKDRFLEKMMPEIKKALREKTPVGSSPRMGKRMRDSWELRKGKNAIHITNTQPYAKHVIQGVRGFIRPRIRRSLKFFLNGKTVYAQKVRGQRPNPIFDRVMQRSRTAVRVAMRSAVLRII